MTPSRDQPLSHGFPPNAQIVKGFHNNEDDNEDYTCRTVSDRSEISRWNLHVELTTSGSKCPVHKGTGSQSVVSGCQQSLTGSLNKAFIKGYSGVGLSCSAVYVYLGLGVLSQTDRQTDRETDSRRERETQTDRERGREKVTERETERQADKQRNRGENERQTKRERQTDRETDRETERRERQTEKQKEGERDRERERRRERKKERERDRAVPDCLKVVLPKI